MRRDHKGGDVAPRNAASPFFPIPCVPYSHFTYGGLPLVLSCETAEEKADYLIDAFLVSKAVRYDIKGRKYIGSPSKFYFEDVGLRNARYKP